jgi:rhamnopyranosyl-N-acetylglucosaminyl-diphospho-decaprenol beta-1,3/1,4-galactofuranosyltransferase
MISTARKVAAGPAFTDLQRAARLLHVIAFMAAGDLRARYRRSVLGPFWMTLGTAAGTVGLGLVWSELLRMDRASFVPSLTAGLIMWQLLSGCLTESTTTYWRQSAILRNLSVPLSMPPIQMLLKHLINFLHNLPVFLAVLLVFRLPVGWATLLAVPGLLLVAANLLWITLLFAMLGARFRDFEYVVGAAMPVLMFLSPVFYRPSYVVDNASDAAGGSGLAQLPPAEGTGAEPVVLRSETNLGGAGGFALGLARAFVAGHDWIWLLDDDALAHPDALAQLLATVDGPDSPVTGAGAVCGAVREFGDIAVRHRRHYHHPTGLERPVPRAAYAGPPCRIDTASFVGFLVSAAAVAEVGFPAREFFLAYDDTEYSLRLGRAGLGIWLVPGSVVEHLRERCARLRAGPFGRKHYFTIRNRIAVARRYASLPILPSCVTLGFGAALWLASAGRLRRGALRILWRAMTDGFLGRMGPYPEALAGLQGAPAQRPPPRSGSKP